ncbi:hydroxyaromatic non-oxidative decarboxylase protein D [Klebsiella pneumoniae]|uniref:Hydroxyaromatic non-oxidative decarboxylase protein D n=1 Tax=Klebsiella pneumoniae TaxID=573 RepID=A0A2X3I3C1_KLEPN|nr:hydroxyaromatic non-oxidative decarboxylase protein D [Klebsiella pneumoniae]
MICPRCADEKIEVMATSPVKGVWTVYQCQHCLYTWRDTEPLRRTSPRTLSGSVPHDAERYR